MRPAFSSTRQAALFTLLLLLLLVSPLLAGKRFLPSREAGYGAEGWFFGPYPWDQKQIFQETNDIDIVIIGSSRLMYAIDPSYVQQQLGAKLGRPAVVRTIGWFQAGYDSLYFAARDLLAHRKVRLLVFADEQPTGHFHVHTRAYRWFTFGDNWPEIAGLPWAVRMNYYSDAILGLPHNLWSLASPPGAVWFKPPTEDFYRIIYNAPNPATRLGAIDAQITTIPGMEFQPFQPTNAVSPADVLRYDSQNRTNFSFSPEGIQPEQLFFLRKLAALTRANATGLLALHAPETNDFTAGTVCERACWPELLDPDVQLVGVPGTKLFAGLTDREKLQLFYNENHLNKNGQQFYTRLVTPALLQIYENNITH